MGPLVSVLKELATFARTPATPWTNYLSFKTETRGPKKTGSFSASDYRFTSLTKQWSRFEATQRSDSAAYDQYIQAMAEVPLKRPGGTRGYAQAAYLSWTATLLARFFQLLAQGAEAIVAGAEAARLLGTPSLSLEGAVVRRESGWSPREGCQLLVARVYLAVPLQESRTR